jgi:hypothetical protein
VLRPRADHDEIPGVEITGLEIVVPPRDLFYDSRLLAAVVFLGGLTLLVHFAPMPFASAAASLAVDVLVWLAIVGLAVCGATMLRRRASLVVDGTELLVLDRRAFDSCSGQWRRDELAAIRVGCVSPGAAPALLIVPKASPACCLQLDVAADDLEFIASVLRQKLRLPVTSPQEIAAAG